MSAEPDSASAQNITAFFAELSRIYSADRILTNNAQLAPYESDGLNEISLSGEERRNLQNATHLSSGGGLRRFMNVGRHLKPGLLFDLGENFQTAVQPRTAKTVNARPIRFVKARLKNQSDAQIFSFLCQAFRDVENELFTLDDARASDEQQRVAGSALETTYRNWIDWHWASLPDQTPDTSQRRYFSRELDIRL
jgi:hypothetical protein